MKNLGKSLFIIVFSILGFSFIVSCEEKEAASVQLDKNSSLEVLIAKMAEDADVQAFLKSNYSLTNKFDTWYDAKSPEEKQAYKQAIKDMRKEGKSAPFEFISPEELQRHYAAQEKLFATIKSKFPELDNPEIKEKFSINDVAHKIAANAKAEIVTAN